MRIQDLILALENISAEHGQGVPVFIDMPDPAWPPGKDGPADPGGSILVDEFDVLIGPHSLANGERRVILR